MVHKMIAVAGFSLFLISCFKEESSEPENAIPDDCLVKASKINGEIIDNAYIITFRNDTGLTTRSSRENFKDNPVIQDADFQLISAEGNAIGLLTDVKADALTDLINNPDVIHIEPERRIAIASCVSVVSPRSVTWSVRKTGYGRIGTVSNKTAWIIDTGVDYDHPDLNVDVVRSLSFISGQSTADDLNGHGTHVAGIIGAKNNAIGILGIASDIKIVALKVLDQLGEGRLSGLISAVRHVSINAKAGDVVNMSLGSEGTSATLDREIRAAAEKGILFAIAAGNDAKNAREYTPANINHRNVLTISAIDSLDRFASFSNYGPDVDIAAYGVKVVSTYKNGQYAILSGTSMAAPHVAGLMLAKGINIPRRGVAVNDPDGVADPIARQ